MPEEVKDVFGHAIDLAQAGGKHHDAKVLAGFRNTGITIEEGSTNVYADLGYVDAAEMQRKSQLAAEIGQPPPSATRLPCT